MISVYGQRATMVSFSALLSISLALPIYKQDGTYLQYSGLLLTGGFLSISFNLFSITSDLIDTLVQSHNV
jgi:hypothetical protein